MKWLDILFGKFLRSMIGIGNLVYYFKVIWNDRDEDYYYILKLLRVKMNKTLSLWGTMTDYENDYHDRDKLKELIDELDLFLEQSFDKTEAQNKKECSVLLGKIGRLLPNLWT